MALRSPLRLRTTPAMAVATRVDEKLVSEALTLLLGSDEGCKVTPTSGGVNNMVQYVDTPTGRLVLRIYNNGGNTARVLWEHAILDALAPLGPFSFALPTYQRAPGTGKTSVLLSNGASACISQLIPGGLPKTADPEPIGRATGELLMALGKVQLPAELVCPTPPYFDVYNVHKAIGGDKEKFYNYVAGKEVDVCRSAIDRLIAQFKVLDARLEAMVAQKLPMQLVHGDLHYDNVSAVPRAWALVAGVCRPRLTRVQHLLRPFVPPVTGALRHRLRCCLWPPRFRVCRGRLARDGARRMPLKVRG